jgi:general stress protein 26
MKVPVTTVDERYSDVSAVATEWEGTARALQTAELFWLTTVRADGRPHVTPLVAVWADGALHFCTGAEEQKALNLRGNPHVVLTTGRNDWKEGLDIVVEGEAARVTDDIVLERLAQAWRAKWEGQWQFQVQNGYFVHPAGHEVLVFSVNPLKILAFAKGPFAQTRHRFGVCS